MRIAVRYVLMEMWKLVVRILMKLFETNLVPPFEWGNTMCVVMRDGKIVRRYGLCRMALLMFALEKEEGHTMLPVGILLKHPDETAEIVTITRSGCRMSRVNMKSVEIFYEGNVKKETVKFGMIELF